MQKREFFPKTPSKKVKKTSHPLRSLAAQSISATVFAHSAHPDAGFTPKWEEICYSWGSLPQQVTSFREIVANPALTRSALRRFAKEDLVSAILALRKRYAEYESGELQARLREKEIELRALEARLTGSQNIAEAVLQYSNTVGDHQYGPMAVKSLSTAMANVVTASAIPTAGGEAEEPDLQERIETALAQGMKWNKNNRKPDRPRAVLRRLQEWETALAKGRQADPAAHMPLGYDTLVREYGGEGFITGLCERAEADRGLPATPSSNYLRVRFRRLAQLYNQPQPQPAAPSDAREIVERFLGTNLPESVLRQKSERLSRWLSHYRDNLRGLDLEALRRLVCPNHAPVFLDYSSKCRPNPNGTDKYQAIVNHKKYDPELQEFWAAYCDEKGWP